MTDWKKTWSVWFNLVIGIASAALAAFMYLQTKGVPWAPMAVIFVNAVTIFLRSIPQTPPEPPESKILAEDDGSKDGPVTRPTGT